MLAHVGRAAAPLALRFQMSGIRRPKFRRRAFGGVFHDPNGVRRETLWENVVPALQSPGYFDAMTNLVGYDIRHRLEEIAKRVEAYRAPEPRYRRGVMAKYASAVSSASDGAVTS